MHGRTVPIAVALGALAALGGIAASLAGASSRISDVRTVHVVERAFTDAVVDTGAEGDSAGDLLTFHNAVFDARNEARVGRDQGGCTRINPHAGTWECAFTTLLERGHISAQGPFYDDKNSKLAITGGTGLYRNADGVMILRHRAAATEFDFIFRLTS